MAAFKSPLSKIRRGSMSVRFVMMIYVAAILSSTLHGDDKIQSGFQRRWVLLHPGFAIRSDEQTDDAIKIIKRASRAGYNGVVLSTQKFTRLRETEPERSYRNVVRVVDAAKQEDIEIIPMVMSINGYSNGILSNDPNLAAAMPVRDCVFEVKNGEARVASGENLLPFGDCEEFRSANKPSGWDWADKPGAVTFADRDERHAGNASIRMQDFAAGSEHGNGRLFKALTLKPWHQYHLRFWLKTKDIANPGAVRVLVHGNVDPEKRTNLQLRSLGAKATQDWTAHDVVFNTRDSEKVRLYAGTWGAGDGTLWFDDFSLNEVAGINLLRRDGCPVQVTSEDGSIAYEEGRDFESWSYPEMGRLRYPGNYAVVHPQPPIRLTKDSRIIDGQQLHVSFFHALMHLNGGMCPCLSHDDLFGYLEKHLRVVRKLYSPKTYLLTNDEIRLAGWCDLCNKPGTTSGTVLARCIRRCTDIVREVDPAAEMVVWSDMFDPHHNAVDDYWYTRDTMKGSWDGLDKDVIIGNWNQGRRSQSLKFFAERGHRQIIATYYDRSSWQQVTKDWLDAAKPHSNVDGIIYVTWTNQYSDLEAFMELVEDHKP